MTAAFVGGMIVLAALSGGVLQMLAVRLQHNQSRLQTLGERINAELPQLQCAECGYAGCRPYAEAIAREEVGIDLCPPGGAETARRLATLLNVDAPPMTTAPPRLLAFIREEDCVGCALCLPVCPTDAIIGSQRHSHTVVAADCVGCALCLPPCPVDCIEMRPPAEWAMKDA